MPLWKHILKLIVRMKISLVTPLPEAVDDFMTFDQLFQPLLKSLSVFGLHFKSETSSIGKILWTPGRMYSTVVVTVIWFRFICTLTAFTPSEEFGALLFFKLVNSCFSLLCAFQATALHFSCLKTFKKFNMLWNEVERFNPVDQVTPIRKCISGITVVGWVLTVSNIAMIFALGSFTTMLDVSALPFTRGHSYFTVALGLSMVTSVWLSAAWIMAVIKNLAMAHYFR